jgi:hypothetical protein
MKWEAGAPACEKKTIGANARLPSARSVLTRAPSARLAIAAAPPLGSAARASAAKQLRWVRDNAYKLK